MTVKQYEHQVTKTRIHETFNENGRLKTRWTVTESIEKTSYGRSITTISNIIDETFDEYGSLKERTTYKNN